MDDTDRHLWDDKVCTFGPTDGGRDGVHDLAMLDQVHAGLERTEDSASAEGGTQVLVAGACPAERAALTRRLARSLPQPMPMQEAGELHEIIEEAARSKIIVLAEDLGGMSADSLIHAIARRHPRVPVVALGHR